MWHKPCRTFHPWCPCIKTRCLFYSSRGGITFFSVSRGPSLGRWQRGNITWGGQLWTHVRRGGRSNLLRWGLRSNLSGGWHRGDDLRRGLALAIGLGRSGGGLCQGLLTCIDRWCNGCFTHYGSMFVTPPVTNVRGISVTGICDPLSPKPYTNV